MREKLIYIYDIKFINSFLFILTTRRELFTVDIDKTIGSVVLTCYVFIGGMQACHFQKSVRERREGFS